MSLNARTLAQLRKDGWLPQVVEQHNTFSGQKTDLFGFIDIIALRDGETLGVQVTSAANMANRINKIESDELADNLAAVRKAGWRLEVWGWKKPTATTGPRRLWRLRVVDVS
jgi:hypothetical protein